MQWSNIIGYLSLSCQDSETEKNRSSKASLKRQKIQLDFEINAIKRQLWVQPHGLSEKKLPVAACSLIIAIDIARNYILLYLERKEYLEKGGELMQAYCVKCRAKKEMKDAKAITMKNGKPATQGVCPTCGTKMFRIGKS